MPTTIDLFRLSGKRGYEDLDRQFFFLGKQFTVPRTGEKGVLRRRFRGHTRNRFPHPVSEAEFEKICDFGCSSVHPSVRHRWRLE